jgi:hypothetical protein
MSSSCDGKAGGGDRAMHLAAPNEVLGAVAGIAGKERQRRHIAPSSPMRVGISLDGGNDDRERYEEKNSQ